MSVPKVRTWISWSTARAYGMLAKVVQEDGGQLGLRRLEMYEKIMQRWPNERLPDELIPSISRAPLGGGPSHPPMPEHPIRSVKFLKLTVEALVEDGVLEKVAATRGDEYIDTENGRQRIEMVRFYGEGGGPKNRERVPVPENQGVSSGTEYRWRLSKEWQNRPFDEYGQGLPNPKIPTEHARRAAESLLDAREEAARRRHDRARNKSAKIGPKPGLRLDRDAFERDRAAFRRADGDYSLLRAIEHERNGRQDSRPTYSSRADSYSRPESDQAHAPSTRADQEYGSPRERNDRQDSRPSYSSRTDSYRRTDSYTRTDRPRTDFGLGHGEIVWKRKFTSASVATPYPSLIPPKPIPFASLLTNYASYKR